MHDITAVIAKPETFGFTFITETVKKYGRTSGPIPLVKVLDVPLFEKSFPGVLLETSDGSSIRVSGQRISRDAWFDGNDHDQKSLQMRLVRWLLKIEQPQAKFVAADGKFYATSEEAQAASVDWAMEQATK